MSLVVNAKLEYALECSNFNVRSFIGAAAPDLAVSESDPVLQDLLQVGSGPSAVLHHWGWSRRPQPLRRCANTSATDVASSFGQPHDMEQYWA